MSKEVKFKTTEEVETIIVFTDPIYMKEGDILIPKAVTIPDNTYVATLIINDILTQ